MIDWERHFPWAYNMVMKIAEPRVVRLIQLGVYICMTIAGIGAMLYPPTSFENLVGYTLVVVFGGFLFLGGLLTSFAILPGIWWLERAGLLCLITGMMMYISIIFTLRASTLGMVVPIAFSLTFILRLIEIRRYQLEPRER